MFGLDVDQLPPGHAAVIDGRVPGFPLRSLKELPPGDYYVQALLNVYSRFHRSDGYVIWAHDQWEGQEFDRAPGSLYSKVSKVHVDPRRGGAIELILSEVVPPLPVAADTEWVKRIKIQSKLLTQFWGRPIYLGAVVLLPRGYAANRDASYPVIYKQGHYYEASPFGFNTEDTPETDVEREFRRKNGIESGYEFYQAWSSDQFPRVLAVTFQHPTPYSDTSYAVNSANQGPYGDAIMTELIPYIEEHFRIIREPYARALTGGSTGGWESLALQLYHPEFFGGAWIFNPDPVDFQRYGLVNIYKENNAYVPDPASVFKLGMSEWWSIDRPMERMEDGQIVATLRQAVRLDKVQASHDRSGGQLPTWEATYGPVGKDGYPQPLWNTTTGEIDRRVANYMREQGYDLRAYAQSHWSKIGPHLIGKLHFYCGDMDNWYLNLGVYRFEDFLRATQRPHYAGSFEYGRPMKEHGWQPMTNAELVRIIAAATSQNAPR